MAAAEVAENRHPNPERTDPLAQIEKITEPRNRTAELLSHFATKLGYDLKNKICRGEFENIDTLIDKINPALDQYEKENNLKIRNSAKYEFLKNVIHELSRKTGKNFASDAELAIKNSLSRLKI